MKKIMIYFIFLLYIGEYSYSKSSEREFNTINSSWKSSKNRNKDLSTQEELYRKIPNGHAISGETKYTSRFGNRRVSKKKYRFHWGVDYGATRGTGINATADGVVEFSGVRGAYGKVVLIDHGFGFKTLYAHLNSINVKRGDNVAKNQLIAKSGNTGRSTGPHLHYEVHYKNERINPENFTEWNGKDYKQIEGNLPNIDWREILAQLEKENRYVKEKKQKERKEV